MIVFTHRPTGRGWEFDSGTGLDGSGKTLDKSKASSEHAARQHFSHLQGYAVLPEDARHQVRHVVVRQPVE